MAQKFYLRTLAKNFRSAKVRFFAQKLYLRTFALLKVRKFGNRTSRKKKILAQKFYLRTLAKKFSLRESSVFRRKVLFADSRTFGKCESSEKELFAKKFFFRSKVLFANFGQKIFAPRKFDFSSKSSEKEFLVNVFSIGIEVRTRGPSWVPMENRDLWLFFGKIEMLLVYNRKNWNHIGSQANVRIVLLYRCPRIP